MDEIGVLNKEISGHDLFKEALDLQALSFDIILIVHARRQGRFRQGRDDHFWKKRQFFMQPADLLKRPKHNCGRFLSLK